MLEPATRPRIRRRTIDVPVFADMLGISRQHAYDLAREVGEIYGARVLRVGRRYLVPISEVEKVLGESIEAA